MHDVAWMGPALSPIGFGAFKIGRAEGVKYPRGYSLPDDADVDRLLQGVLGLGINLIDTAPAYGTSEEHIGRCLASRRSEFILSTKVGETFDGGRSTYDFSTEAVTASIERSLARLRTDVLDIVWIHAPRNDLDILESSDVVSVLARMKRDGAIRAIGLSGHTDAAMRHAFDWADALMVEYHMSDSRHEALMTQAAARGLLVVVKKPLASGHLPAEEAIRFALRPQAVSSVVVGSLSLEHLKANCDAARRVRPWSFGGAGPAHPTPDARP